MTTIEITHQIEKTKHRFRVKDENKLTSSAVDKLERRYSKLLLINKNCKNLKYFHPLFSLKRLFIYKV